MLTGTDFMAAILADPEDDAPRLQFSDWLNEQGRGERAEFIRVQVSLAGYGKYDCPKGELACMPVIRRGKLCSCRRCILGRRERELLSTIARGELLGCEMPMCVLASIEGKTTIPTHGFRRGFLESVTMTAADWLAHGDAILAAQPVREVTLTTWPDARALVGMATDRGWPLYQIVTHGTALLEAIWPRVKAWHLPPLQEFEIAGEVRTGQMVFLTPDGRVSATPDGR